MSKQLLDQWKHVKFQCNQICLHLSSKELADAQIVRQLWIPAFVSYLGATFDCIKNECLESDGTAEKECWKSLQTFIKWLSEDISRKSLLNAFLSQCRRVYLDWIEWLRTAKHVRYPIPKSEERLLSAQIRSWQQSIVCLGDLMRYAGKSYEAIDWYLQAVTVKPNDGKCYHQLAVTLMMNLNDEIPEKNSNQWYLCIYFLFRSVCVKCAYDWRAARQSFITKLQSVDFKCDSLISILFRFLQSDEILLEHDHLESAVNVLDLEKLPHTLPLLLTAMIYQHDTEECYNSAFHVLKFLLIVMNRIFENDDNVDKNIVLSCTFMAWWSLNQEYVATRCETDNSLKSTVSSLLIYIKMYLNAKEEALANSRERDVLPLNWICRGFVPLRNLYDDNTIFSNSAKTLAEIKSYHLQIDLGNDDIKDYCVRLLAYITKVLKQSSEQLQTNSHSAEDPSFSAVVVDTNILLNHFEIVQMFLDGGIFSLYIPSVAICELTGLANENPQARQVLHDLNRNANSPVDRSRRSSNNFNNLKIVSDTGKPLKFNECLSERWNTQLHRKNLGKYQISTDDIFVSLSLILQKQEYNLHLVTSDTNLRIRARQYTVKTMKPADLLDCLANKPQKESTE